MSQKKKGHETLQQEPALEQCLLGVQAGTYRELTDGAVLEDEKCKICLFNYTFFFQNFCLWSSWREGSQKPQWEVPRGLHLGHLPAGERWAAVHLSGAAGGGCLPWGEGTSGQRLCRYNSLRFSGWFGVWLDWWWKIEIPGSSSEI